jgi:hypothetical protein
VLHSDDIVEEIETKRQGKIDEAPKRETDVLRWRVWFLDGETPVVKYFLKETELRLITCPHSDSDARFIAGRGIKGS